MRIGLALPHYDFSLPGVDRSGSTRVAEVAVRAERLGFDCVWVSDHFFSTLERYGGGPTRYGSLEPLDHARVARAADRARAARDAGALGRVPSSGDPGEVRDGDRPPLGRPARARHGRGLVRGGVRGVRLRVRDGGGAVRAARGDPRVPRRAVRTASPRRSRDGGSSSEEAYNHPRPVQEPRPPLLVGGKGGPRLLRHRRAARRRLEHRVAVDARGLRGTRGGGARGMRARGARPGDASGSRSGCSRSSARTRPTWSGGTS